MTTSASMPRATAATRAAGPSARKTYRARWQATGPTPWPGILSAAGRPEDKVEGVGLVALHAGLDHGRDLGRDRRALGVGIAQDAQLASTVLLQGGAEGFEHPLDVVCHHVLQRRPRSLVRHVHDID